MKLDMLRESTAFSVQLQVLKHFVCQLDVLEAVDRETLRNLRPSLIGLRDSQIGMNLCWKRHLPNQDQVEKIRGFAFSSSGQTRHCIVHFQKTPVSHKKRTLFASSPDSIASSYIPDASTSRCSCCYS